jgi:type II secretory pathway component PulF
MRKNVLSIGLLTMNLLLLWGIEAVGLFGIPRAVGVFSNMGAALPLPTRLVIQIPPYAWVAAASAITALLVIKEFVATHRTRLQINIYAMVALLWGVVMLAVVIARPLYSLTQPIQ